MKKASVMALFLLFSGVAMAATIRDNCGVGLGTMLLGDAKPTLVAQLGATFLNSLCGNQTFAITFGTLGADPHEGIASNQALEQFVGDNMDQLAMDMATGNGDTLVSLADLMGVESDQRKSFYGELQKNFDSVFTSEDVTAGDVVENLAKI